MFLISAYIPAAPAEDAAEAAAEELAALDEVGTQVAEEEGPAATAHQNLDTGTVDLDIDLSVLDLPRPPALVTKLLGSNWQVRDGPHPNSYDAPWHQLCGCGMC